MRRNLHSFEVNRRLGILLEITVSKRWVNRAFHCLYDLVIFVGLSHLENRRSNRAQQVDHQKVLMGIFQQIAVSKW